jgi:hypothetical protein
MADVSAIFGILLSLGIVFPGLLTAWWLLFPATVERARLRLDRTPWQCLWLGGVGAAGLVIPVAILLALPVGPAKLVGWGLIGLVLAVASLGAAGLASKMARRLHADGGTQLGSFVRAAIALELAAAFPLLGWFIVIPLTVVMSLGAALFALLRWSRVRRPNRTKA